MDRGNLLGHKCLSVSGMVTMEHDTHMRAGVNLVLTLYIAQWNLFVYCAYYGVNYTLCDAPVLFIRRLYVSTAALES